LSTGTSILLLNFQIYTHSNGFETLHQHIPREILPNEYGGEAGKLEELHGRYCRAHCIVTDNISQNYIVQGHLVPRLI
jgi:hypothetical protein